MSTYIQSPKKFILKKASKIAALYKRTFFPGSSKPNLRLPKGGGAGTDEERGTEISTLLRETDAGHDLP